MTVEHTFTLESWLETHNIPMIIINDSLKIVAVNQAFEKHFAVKRIELVGSPCCVCQISCRHRQFFDTRNGYTGYFSDNFLPTTHKTKNKNLYWYKGDAIRNTVGELLIVETINIPHAANKIVNEQLMVGVSPLFFKLKAKLLQIADSNVPVLLNGETGTGKEVAAKFIHQHSKRVKGDFIVVDCTLLTESLCESELFGHEKGAFTNAVSFKVGLFELANNGTLFLDEIGELPLSQQPKLLRALETGQFRRVGGTKTLSSKVRVICATHRHLIEMVKEGRFREDLYYRLSALAIDLPPLRERKQDIPLLIEHLLHQEGHHQSLSQQATSKILQHSWPGNIRELRNCLQLAVALANQTQVMAEHVQIVRRRSRPADINHAEGSHQSPSQKSVNIGQTKNQVEIIRQLLDKHQGNRKHVAAEIGISERTLYRQLNKLRLR